VAPWKKCLNSSGQSVWSGLQAQHADTRPSPKRNQQNRQKRSNFVITKYYNLLIFYTKFHLIAHILRNFNVKASYIDHTSTMASADFALKPPADVKKRTNCSKNEQFPVLTSYRVSAEGIAKVV
jgi:hypothetical protein